MTQLYKSLIVLFLQSAEQCCYRPNRTCCDFAPVGMSQPPALVLSPEREGRAAELQCCVPWFLQCDCLLVLSGREEELPVILSFLLLSNVFLLHTVFRVQM